MNIVTDPYTHNKQAQGQSTQIENHDLHFPKAFTSGPFGLVKQLVWVGTWATSHADSPVALFSTNPGPPPGQGPACITPVVWMDQQAGKWGEGAGTSGTT